MSAIAIDEQQKSITFEIISKTLENNPLELRLPSELLDGPFVVWVDDQKLSDFDHIEEMGVNVLLIPLDVDSKIITIVGTSSPRVWLNDYDDTRSLNYNDGFLSQRFKTRI